jgi:glyoxylase-like metal-dependent hydrolase (beta-lactamase superfamily II)
MYFRQLHDESTGLASYLLADLDAAQAVLIDPRAADVPVLAAMLDEHRLRLRWVLRTHAHDAQLPLERPVLTTLGAPIVEHGTREAARALVDFGAEQLRVLPTPGHTEGCLSFLWRDRLFCGGLLAADACPHQPRPALPDALWRSVTQMVFTLPAETLLFGGHSRRGRLVSTVLEQRRWHPWFGRASRDDFLTRLRESAATVPEGLPS